MTSTLLVVLMLPAVVLSQQLRWVYAYDGPGGSSDEAWPMVLGADSNLYAAGWSTGTGLDLTVASVTLSGQGRWVYRYNGPAGGDDAAHAVAFGTDRNVYAAGVSLGSGTSSDVTVVSLDNAGQQRWVYRYDGPVHARDEARSIVCGQDGNIYVGGWSEGSGTGVDFIVISVDTAGNERWVYRYNGPANLDDKDTARMIAYGSDGNIYAAGWSEGIGTGPDFVVVSLTNSGQERWVYRYNGPGNGRDAAWGVVWGADGNVHAAGYSTGNGTGLDMTAVSLTPAGQERWVYRKATNGRDQAWGLAAGPDGTVYPGGELNGRGSDFAVVAVDSTGHEKWVYAYDGPEHFNDYVGPVHFGADGNIYASGRSYSDQTDFDCVVASISPAGQERWVYRYNGPGSGWDNGEAVVLGPDGHVYVAGSSYKAGSGQDFTVLSVGAPTRHDVRPVQILAPIGTIDSGTVITPRVAVRNQGTFPEVFPVTLLIGSGYNQTVAETLTAGAMDTLAFPDWVASPTGTLPVMGYTSLAGDEDPHNDTITTTVRVTVGQPQAGDVGVNTILAPAGTVDSGTLITPLAVVRNLGADSAIFPVQMRIGTSYAVVVNETLPAGMTDTVTFLDWVAQPVGTQSVVCFTALVGDSNPQNDTCVGSVRVATGYQVDVGTVAIVAPPASIESGGSCLPKALVRNFGLTDAVFPVTMCIDTSYRHTVQDTLAPGASDTVVFRQWIADPVGTHPIVCFTQLAGDQNTGNDTVFGAVRVGGPASHDVGTLAILDPGTTAKDGDTIVPRALLHNFGLWPERYFDVRFRIGSAYEYNVAVFNTLSPDSTVTVTFPAWIAVAGSHPVSCSTMLYSDAYTLNDKLTTTTHVTSRRHLLIEPDQADVVEVDEARSFPFYAEAQGDTGFTVRLDDLVIPTGWTAEFYDSTGRTPVCTLGFLLPGVQSWFNLQVQSPDALSGDTALLGSTAFVVRGHVVGDSTMSDSAVLTLRLVPELSVHNFPNPLQGSTRFVIGLPAEGTVSLTIYNRAGELIRRVIESEKLASGVHVRGWDARNESRQTVAPGTYEYILDYSRPGKSQHIRKKLVVTSE